MMPFDCYFDKNGLMVRTTQPYPEDGDGTYTVYDTTLYRFGKAIKTGDMSGREAAKFQQELDMLEDPRRPGWFRSHPEATEPWSRSNLLKPSELLCLIITMGSLEIKDYLKKTFKAHTKRLGFFQDGTYSSVTDMAVWIRAFYAAGFSWAILGYPLVVLCDLLYFLKVMISNTNLDECLMRLLQSEQTLPTPISKLLVKSTDWVGVGKILQEWHDVRKGSPPIYEQLYADILKEYK